MLDFLWKTPFEILGRGDGKVPYFSMTILNKKRKKRKNIKYEIKKQEIVEHHKIIIIIIKQDLLIKTEDQDFVKNLIFLFFF